MFLEYAPASRNAIEAMLAEDIIDRMEDPDFTYEVRHVQGGEYAISILGQDGHEVGFI
ncbi:hypothetical protein [Pyruvatibacter mobilis]|uniref:hypothetical protein n=1 Tax=Pyruvatibacter mobilis TaxID=1712261 RepID=UPI003BAC1A9C